MLSGAKAQNIINLAMQSPVLRLGGNSTITRVDFEQRSYAVKDYSARADGYQRLKREFSALEFLHPELPERFAEPLGIGSDGQRAIYSWLNGTRPVLDQECVTHMLDIASELNLLRNELFQLSESYRKEYSLFKGQQSTITEKITEMIKMEVQTRLNSDVDLKNWTKLLSNEIVSDINIWKENFTTQLQQIQKSYKDNSGECSGRAQQLSHYIDD